MADEAVLSASIRLLERLVAFPTVSGTSNLDLIDWTASGLAAQGARVAILPSEAGDRANLFATFGSEDDGGLVLSGHTDVVPADPGAWLSDPFRLTARGSRLYGRGTTDMKGFIACVLAWAGNLDASRLKVPVHIALSYDEELGCLGISGIIDAFGKSLPTPALAVVGEPTGMRAVGTHKGYRVFRTTITGMPTHASSPASGVSAIRLAGAFHSALEALSRELATQDHIDGGMDPPFTTVNIGRIAGGTAVNIVASDCVIEWELRPVPGTDLDAVLQRLDGLVEAALPSDLAERGGIGRIATTLLASEPVFASPPDGLAGRLIGCLTGRSDLGAVAYGTEAGFFQQAGVSTILLGPGNIDRAHRPDEFIEVGELGAQFDFLIALERQLCTHGLNDL